MDPFESSVRSVLEERKKVAEKIVASRIQKEPTSEEDFSVQDRIPFSISQTIQYLKADEYQRTKKALKKQKETI